MKKRLGLFLCTFLVCLVAVLLFPERAYASDGVRLELIVDGECVEELFVTRGEAAVEPEPPIKEGYRFVGWRSSDVGDELYEWTSPVYEDTTLYAVFELAPPAFELDSLSFVYDGKSKYLAFRSITHPLLDEGFLIYEWFKDGEPLDYAGESLEVREVADSGAYTCRLTLSVAGSSAYVVTPEACVSIEKRRVPLPTIPQREYTGEPIYPEIFDTGDYTVQKEPKTGSGSYPVAVTLRDKDNCAFVGCEGEVAYIEFRINPAQNFWTSAPTVSDTFQSFAPTPTAHSRFGEPTFLFAPVGGEYSESVPSSVGSYYMIAIVAKTDDYSALESEPILFHILDEKISGIKLRTVADKLDYVAFERLDPSGMELLVSYNSGRSEAVDGSLAKIIYQNGDCLLFGDTGVVVSYGGASVLLPVSVRRADYDLTGVGLADSSTVYNGELPKISYLGTLPVGKDGIPLVGCVVGAGVGVGRYTIELQFSSESRNYNIPEPISAVLTVLPRPVTVSWERTSFVYDGTQKLPVATFTDVYGRICALSVSGARTYAGTYTAEASLADQSYLLENPTVTFEILKADYDLSGAFWLGGMQLYDGTEHTVSLENLPSGVSVAGYVDNRATAAGRYVAKAAFSYDRQNYNPPSVPDYEWYIYKAEYPISYSFPESVAPYDGEAHYPILVGSMPTGQDGIALEYSFDKSATHVDEGRVAVTVSFFTKSENYIPPSPIITYISISPAYISVEWHNLEFRYTGAAQCPYATANECEISVTGGAVGAGEYTAYATPQLSDYALINPTVSFVILKAENKWLIEPSVSDIFFGATPSPSAEALGGAVEFTYYDAAADAELTSAPSDVGEYYVVAYAAGDENYLGITSEPLYFKIIAIVPVELTVELTGGELFAFDTVSYIASTVNNDGSETPLDPSLVRVIYERADSLRHADTQVSFTYGEFTVSVSVTVKKCSFDTSSVAWTTSDFVYDGTEHSIYLTGLPEGLSVEGYQGNGICLAGRYTVLPILSYDGENFHEPIIPEGQIVIKKQTVPLPEIPSKIYTGYDLTPEIPASPLYSFAQEGTMRAAGVYRISFSLTDPNNYELEREVGYFVIEKRPLSVKINDMKHYVFESLGDFSFTLTEGELAAGDVITPTYTVRGNEISAVFDNPNYSYSVTEGRIERIYAPSPEQTPTVLIAVFLLLMVLLVVALFFTQRQKIIIAAAPLGGGDDTPPTPDTPTGGDSQGGPTPSEELSEAPEPEDEPNGAPPPEAEEPEVELSEVPEAELPEQTGTLAVSAERADSLISNSLAKSLIRREESVVTDGKRRGIVNVDTLSRSFSSGERVDINALKSHSLIPYDTGYIKVLARGVIDKPLFVYANDFSLSAVKMIALTGGRAVKVATETKKEED